jgi:hypothetical protein
MPNQEIPPNTTNNVTQNLGHYDCLVDLNKTKKVPSDWCVIVTDIAGSTVAIREGRYKEVNMVGAACIAAVRNQFSQKSVPYVFGGDGATFLCHNSNLEKCLSLLAGIQSVAKSQMKFILRVGFVNVAEIELQGGEIYLGFVEWSEHECQPFFRGNGISIAENIIKSKRLEESNPSESKNGFKSEHVKGLSCRLNPFQSERGNILSLLIEPLVSMEHEDKLFRDIFDAVRGNFPLFDLNPIKESNKKRSPLGPGWRSEAKILSKNLGFFEALKVYFRTLIAHILTFYVFKKNKYNSTTGSPEVYEKHMLKQSDWIKCDGVLRMVLDVSKEDENTILNLLEEKYQRGEIFYGSFASKSALMTCFVESAVGQKHTHFIDGGNGGFTAAAVGLKNQKKNAMQPQNSKFDFSTKQRAS